MSLNKVLLKPENQLVKTVKQHSRYIREMKTPQKIGGDILTVQGIPDNNSVFLSSDYLGPNSTIDFNISILTNIQTLTLWNFAWTLYVDPTIFNGAGLPDPTFQWPSGAALNNAKRNIAVCPRMDWANSNDSNNLRNFKVSVFNMDTAWHTYYMAYRMYLPNINQ